MCSSFARFRMLIEYSLIAIHYMTKLRQNIVYLFKYSTVASSKIGDYQTHMTISPTLSNQAKLLKYFQ